jgi:hypothetical protein
MLTHTHTCWSLLMIDANKEALLTFAQAAKKIPPRRGGRPVHVSTIHRWAMAGVRGERLESLLVGGTRMTSVEALQRFYERLSQEGATSVPPVCSPSKGHLEAEHRLAAKGF